MHARGAGQTSSTNQRQRILRSLARDSLQLPFFAALHPRRFKQYRTMCTCEGQQAEGLPKARPLENAG